MIDLDTIADLPFDEVYRRHAGQIYLFCLSQVASRADAEDVAAEVFAAALVAYRQSPPPAAAVKAWLLRIARNRIIDTYRSRERRSRILERFFSRTDEPPADEYSIEEQVVLRDDLQRALACIRRLGGRDRQLLGLRIVAGLSHAEVGEVLGLSPHAAAVGYSRALERLRRLYEQPT